MLVLEKKTNEEISSRSDHKTAIPSTSMTTCSSASSEDAEIEMMIKLVTKEVAAKLALEGRSLNKSTHSQDSVDNNIDIDAVSEHVLKALESRSSTGVFAKMPSVSNPSSKKLASLRSSIDSIHSLRGSVHSATSTGSAASDPDFWCADLIGLDYDEEEEDCNSAPGSRSSIGDDTSIVSDISSLSGGVRTTRFPMKAMTKSMKKLPTVTADMSTIVVPGSPTENERTTLVRFGRMIIREYETIIDANPSTKSGPSLAIGDKYTEFTGMDIDTFERYRIGRRFKRHLVLGRAKREAILRRLGYGDEEIADATRKINKMQAERAQTVSNLSSARVEEVAEAAKRSFKKIFSIRRRNETTMD